MFGKLIDGQLQIAGNEIKTDKGTVTNPNEELLKSLGYKEIVYTEKPEYDKENEKLSEIYNESETEIIVTYTKVELSPSEHNAIIKQEIVEEENKLTSRNIRNAIKGDSFALSKIDEIEANIQALRAKLVEEQEEDNDGNIN